MSVSKFDVIDARVGPAVSVAGRATAFYRATIVTGGTTTDVAVNLPVGGILRAADAFTTAAATGAPTNANLTLGKTLGGAEYVAATDVKAAGKTALAFAAANIADILSLPAAAGAQNSPNGNPSAVNARITFVGGTSPTATVDLILECIMPYTAPTDGHGL